MSSRAVACCCIALLLLALPVRVAGQESLAAARQLYAAAEYQDALALLGALLASNPPPQERQTIELYRIFCFFAINDLENANSGIEALIARDPLFRPGMDVVPRRLRTAFTDARKRLLPGIIQEKYVVAKTAFDEGDFKAASEGFTQTLVALSDPDVAAEAERRPLADLRVLAAGFNELAVRALAPADPPAEAPPPAHAAAPLQPKIYESRDPSVIPPVVVRQELPPFHMPIVVQRTGQLEVVIDERGAVESATIVASLEPRYNQLVLAAAKLWRYRPATVDGAPVKFRKRIQLTLSPER